MILEGGGKNKAEIHPDRDIISQMESTTRTKTMDAYFSVSPESEGEYLLSFMFQC